MLLGGRSEEADEARFGTLSDNVDDGARASRQSLDGRQRLLPGYGVGRSGVELAYRRAERFEHRLNQARTRTRT